MRGKRANPGRIIAEIAARQYGVISLAQLHEAGLSHDAVRRWTAAGHLHRLHRGVYAVGNPNLKREGHWMAAVLAVEGSVLSHGSAAALWGISSTCPRLTHVTVRGASGRRKRRGIVVHRSKTLFPEETTRHRGIPVTTHARTLRDLGYGPEPTKSDLERLFLRLCRSHGIPKPEVNVELGPYTVDFHWPAERLVVEVDSYRYHSSRAVFGADRVRSRALGMRGIEVVRFTDREVAREPVVVASSVLAHLRRRSGSTD